MKTRFTARLSLPSLFSSLSVKTSISTRTHVDKNLLILQISLMMSIMYSSPLSITFLIGHSMTKTSCSFTMLLGTCQESLLTSDTTHPALALGLVLLPLSPLIIKMRVVTLTVALLGTHASLRHRIRSASFEDRSNANGRLCLSTKVLSS